MDQRQDKDDAKLACLASEASCLQPGVTYVQGNRESSAHDSISDDEGSASDDFPPVLQAEIAPDISKIVEKALRESTDSVHADLLAPVSLGGFWLPRLDDKSEDRFQQEHAQLIRVPTMVYLSFAIVVNALFYLWDLLQVSWERTLGLRVILTVWFLVWFVVFQNGFHNTKSQPLSLFKLVGAYTVVCLIARQMMDGFVVALPGLCITILTFNAICLLQFRYALVLSLYALVLVNVWIQTHPHNSGVYSTFYVAANANAFMLMSCVMGLLPVYVAEMYLRHRFLRTGTLSFWVNASEHTSNNQSDPI